MIRVGIPRGLLYYSYFPLWRAFFTEMGAEIVLSPETNKAVLDAGLRSALDETCLPVKLFFGHVLALPEVHGTAGHAEGADPKLAAADRCGGRL
jgi:predicted nucleotide-binding protein (sugar kinase/HSP70/actin superfamily)